MKIFRYVSLVSPLIATLFAAKALASELPSIDAEFDELLSLDINDLIVSTVSRRDQNLNDTAAATYVITQDDLRRSGVTSIPEALRMVPGLNVARVSSNSWAVSSRGFNGALANKLLVMIDGRSIYTPVFSGTYWDDQSTLIEDIDRIEVIRGPGASLWGSNAVDGVINIITKRADETQGNLISATGSLGGGLIEGRHGGKIDDNTYYRAYATYLDAGSTENPAHISNPDDWNRTRAGFRMDRIIPGGDSYTFQGDAYGGDHKSRLSLPIPASGTQLRADDEASYGGNLLGRWNHQVSKDSQISLQAYLDHYSRDDLSANQHVSTADIQLQNSIRLDDRNNFIWGGGARLYAVDLAGSFSASVAQQWETHHILNMFAQDEYALLPDTLYLTLGSKFEHNDFTGLEIEPSARLSWHPTNNQTVWGAISRAIRTPSIVDEEINLVSSVTPGAPPTETRIFGDSHQESEELIAYELGHRIQPLKNLSFDTALYWNEFSQLETINSAGPNYIGADGNTVRPFILSNLGSGHVYGAEIAANWNVTKDWRLTGSYSYAKMNLDVKSGAFSLQNTERLAPRNQYSVRSYLNLTESVHWDNMLYYVDHLSPPVSSYWRYDSRIAWLVHPGVEISLIGKNLLEPSHAEFPSTPQAEINRSVIGQVLWKF